MTLAPGTTVGRYQILEPLGQGGMATVYKAFQPSLQREVALKVLRPGYSQDAEFKERFEREAIAIAKLRHPNIVQVFDFEAIEGQYALAMEFLEGGTLKERLTQLAEQRRGLDTKDTVRIVWEVADALSYAHERGIVHRDIKPSNVMLAAPRERAVVTDFGIARILGATSHTQTGVGIGTPEYMAPEQGQGGAIDQRADIYSLGAMAYEMLTGRVPFIADTPLAVVLAHMKDPLPLPSQVNPTIGKNLERALLKALAKDPAQRFDSAIGFAEAVRDGVARDAAGGTVPTIVVRGGAAPTVTARAETAMAPAKLALSRPALAIVGSALAIVLIGGGAIVTGSLGARSGPRAEPTATAVVLTTASPAPTVGAVTATAAALPAATVTPAAPIATPTAILPPTPAQQTVVTPAPATPAPTAAATEPRSPTPVPTPTPTLRPGTESVRSTIALGARPEAVAFNRRTDRAYVANGDDNSVAVIDVTTSSLITSVAVGRSPVRIAVNATTNRVYAPNRDSGDMSVIDGATNRVVATVTLGSLPEGVDVDERSDRIYVANRGSNTVAVVDGSSNTVTATIPMGPGSGPEGIAFNVGTNRVYVANFNAGTVSVIDAATLRIVRTLPVGPNPLFVAVEPSTGRVYVTNSAANSVSVIDASNDSVLTSIAVGSFPVGVAADPATKRVYVANASSNTVSVIDASTNSVVRTIVVGSAPYGIAVHTDRSLIYGASNGSRSITVIQ